MTPLFVLATLLAQSATSQTWSPPATWPFEPKPDEFRADALLDLRYLNEKTAGESGYVAADPEGDFRLGNGKPVRFWAVNSGVGREVPFHPRPLGRQTEPSLARHARFLAKRGVNMIRLHTQITPAPSKSLTDINESERDWIWRSVAAMKKEGIYTTLSPYWMVPTKFGKNWGIPGDPEQSAGGLLFFDPTLQKGYREWLRKLLTEPNPYTGVPLAKDPALAIFEIQNEDSLLFWTFGNIKGEQKTNLGKLFGQFLAGKYGSIPKAQAAWGQNTLPGDDPSKGIFDFIGLWEVPQQLAPERSKRLGDQIEFLTVTMKNFNDGIVRFLRNDLGCKALVNAGNWRTADPTRLQDAERYSYTPTEVDAVNKYFGGIHQGPNEGWAIQNGDKFTSPSILKEPRSAPFAIKQTMGRPMLVTESSWVFPNGYGTEGPFLTAAYQSLSGLDAYYWFATGDDEWTPPESANGYNPSQSKWIFGYPDVLGTFPAAALMYRSGYVKRGAPAVVEVRRPEDMWNRRTPVISEEPGFDPNRDAKDLAPGSGVSGGVDQLAFFVGPVQVKFSGSPNETKSIASKYISPGEVESDTGELKLNYDKGFCTVDTPCAQGVAAFFSAKPTYSLADVTFASPNEYGAALAVSMDGKAIHDSKKVLVQFGTRSRPTGWVEKPATIQFDNKQSAPGLEVVSYGKAPWQVIKADLVVSIKNTGLKKASVLDMNGNRIADVPLTKAPGAVKFTFPSTAMYVVLEGG